MQGTVKPSIGVLVWLRAEGRRAGDLNSND
jgi:hypothetical protein